MSAGKHRLSSMIFATSQPASEFPTEGVNGQPDNFSIFCLFSEQDFLTRQHNIWEDSRHKYNCTRTLYEGVIKYIGYDFLVNKQGLVVATSRYTNDKYMGELDTYDNFNPVFRFQIYMLDVLVSPFNEAAEQKLRKIV